MTQMENVFKRMKITSKYLGYILECSVTAEQMHRQVEQQATRIETDF
jgi:hypothetical protein